MTEYNELKNNINTNIHPDEYIDHAIEYTNQFQVDHHGILNINYLTEINNHYATPEQLTRLFDQINVPIRFKQPNLHHYYKLVLNGSTDPINIESITKDDVNNIHVVPVSDSDKSIVFGIIDDMVEEYLDETDSVHL
ncbi:hypothetical protein [Nicoliella lavandulae]|uniref:Uncharacterized protein n=1 Tax=Nicoliella lavandulae TaxID=3082954 RepID=A0ABU8SMQ1_9LACO